MVGIKGYFAVLSHTIVASGSTEKELWNSMEKVVPEDKKNWVC